MKRILKSISVFLSFMLVFSVCVLQISALELNADGFTFTRNDNEAVIVGFSSNSPLASANSITIPDYLLSYPVAAINNNAFMDNDSMQNLTLNDNLRIIGDSAFYGNSSLQAVTIPANVTSIGSAAFYSNLSLNRVSFAGALLREIKDFTFAYDTSLTEIVLPENLRTISQSAFLGCTSLNRVYIPESVTYVDKSAFKNCPVTIYGYSDSAAQEYADAHGLKFVAVDWNSSYVNSLNEKCQAANKILTTDAYKYTEDSLEALQTAVSNSLPLLDTVFVSGEELTSASKTIDSAINALEKIKYGDADLNGEVELEDAALVQKALAKSVVFNEEQLKLVDLDRNGKFEIEDGVLIQKMIAGAFSI